MTASTSAFLNQNGPIIPCFKIATQTVHYTECKGLWSTSSVASVPHYTQLLLLTCSQSLKYASSLNQTSWRKSRSYSILFTNHRHITRSGFCKGTAEDTYFRFFAMMHGKDQVLGNVFRGTFSDSFRQNLSPISHCQDILQSTSCQIWDLFTFLLKLFTDPVSWNLCTQRSIWLFCG